MSKYGVISGLYFPLFGLNTKIYEVNLRIQSEYRKYGPEIAPYLDTFHAVRVSEFEAYDVSLIANILFVLFQIQTLLVFFFYLNM